MNEFGIALAWCVIQVTLVSLLALGVSALARRYAPAAGAYVPLAGLLTIVSLSALATSPWPNWWNLPFARNETRSSNVERNSFRSDPISNEVNSQAASPGGPQAASALSHFWQSVSHELGRSTHSRRASPARRWPLAFTVLLGGVALVGAFQLLAGLAAVRSYRLRSHPIEDAALTELVDVLRAELSLIRSIELRQCDDLVTAATVGWRRPLVLLPPEWKTWNENERRAVLAHELAHIARHDYLGALLAQFSLALHFYHPLVHWLAGRLRLEQELAADAAAAALAGGPNAYLRTLADLALRQPDRRLSWPARTFLPTRGTFLRRIEMLRDTRKLAAKPSLLSRLSLVALVLLAGLVAAGLRGPTGAASGTALAQTKPLARAVPDTSGIDSSLIAEDAVAVIAVRPAGLLNRPEMKDLRVQLDEMFAADLTLSPGEVEQITLVQHRESAPLREPARITPISGVIIRATQPNDFKKLAERSCPGAVEKKLGGAPNQTYYKSGDAKHAGCYYRPDERTIFIDLEEHVVRSIVAKPKKAALLSGEAWKKAAEGQLAVALDGAWLRKMLAPADERAGGAAEALLAQLAAFSPLYLESDVLTLSARLDKNLTISATAVCGTAEGAKKVQETAEAGRTLAKNLTKPLRKQLADAPAAERPILDALLELGELMLDELKFARTENIVEGSTSAEIDPLKLSLLAMTVVKMRGAADRASSMNNLKQIALAFHNYHDVYGHFPAASILGPDGKTVHSWRVAILPFIEQEALYRQYKFDEPWDSEHNKKIAATVVPVYRHPHAPADSTSSAYYLLTGDTAVFPDKPSKSGLKILDIHDGTSNTILCVETKRDIPWTKPEDIPFTMDKPLPKLGGWTEGGFNAALCDGSVRFLPDSLDEKNIRRLMMRADGEAVNFDAPERRPLPPRRVAPQPGATPRPAPRPQ